jgi:hypothetical protein
LRSSKIFYSPDAQIESDALETFRAMVLALYPEGKENSIDTAQEIIKECQELLKEPEKSKAKPATKILCGLITASREPNYLANASMIRDVNLTLRLVTFSKCRSFRYIAGHAAIIPTVSYRIRDPTPWSDSLHHRRSHQIAK